MMAQGLSEINVPMSSDPFMGMVAVEIALEEDCQS
jgi:hypothetical protein